MKIYIAVFFFQVLFNVFKTLEIKYTYEHKVKELMLNSVFINLVSLGSIYLSVDNLAKGNWSVLIVYVAGTPKADFALAAGDTAKIFISHKDGSKPTDFLRWSGISSIKDDPAVASFVEAIKEENGGVFEPGQTYTRPITEEGFAYKAIYGKDFGSEEYGINNVQCVIQGSVTLTPADGVYELGGTGNIWTGEIPEGAYAPVFFAQYRSGRRDLGLENCESLVTPATKITRNTKSI